MTKPLKSARQVRKIVRHPYHRVKRQIKKGLGWVGGAAVLPYRGFGNRHNILVRGRVVESYSLASPKPHHSVWVNMLTMLKRYLGYGLAGMRLQIEFMGMQQEVTTDEQGFFEVWFRLDQPLPDGTNWYQANIRLADMPEKVFIGEVLLPAKDCEFGVISDIDDTFLVSHSTDLLRKLWLLLLKNAHTRLPFDGVSAFYHSLRRGRSGKGHNPVFYVSSSEWNIYDLLQDFCKLQNIPKGVFLLREMDVSPFRFWKKRRVNHNHKLDKIRNILRAYPQMQFILIGDSGQRDAEIYSEISKNYSGQIRAIYIRHVAGRARHQAVTRIARSLRQLNIPMLLVKDTEDAAIHACKQHYIHQNSLKEIMADTRRNQQLPEDWEELLL